MQGAATPVRNCGEVNAVTGAPRRQGEQGGVGEHPLQAGSSLGRGFPEEMTLAWLWKLSCSQLGKGVGKGNSRLKNPQTQLEESSSGGE